MDTICAIATPSGGAIGVVRVSGNKAIGFTEKIFKPKGSTPLSQKAGSTLTFGTIVDPATNEVVDEVLVSVFRAPHSYTGEDACELSCHGSEYILTRVLQLLIHAGCRMARAGEYTERAFLNGKMDLSQAEAVADLIASTTAANHRMAMQQMRGGFSQELRELRDQLLHITSLLELELDFSDHEELEFASRPELLSLSQTIHNHLSALCQSFRLGNALKRGVPVAIVGEANAGKSTLLNALLCEERALVSDVKGTTRDTIEETFIIGDTLVRFIDTAGIRTTTDRVERMGIDRTFEKMKEADVVLWLIDATCALEQWNELWPKLSALCCDKQLLVLLNKKDLLSAHTLATVQNALSDKLKSECATAAKATLLTISAQQAADIEALRTQLSCTLLAMKAEASSTGTIVSNLRHYEALSAALTAIDRVTAGLESGLSGDFISQDLRECIHHLSDIVGEVTTDAVLGNIFKHFCIGK